MHLQESRERCRRQTSSWLITPNKVGPREALQASEERRARPRPGRPGTGARPAGQAVLGDAGLAVATQQCCPHPGHGPAIVSHSPSADSTTVAQDLMPFLLSRPEAGLRVGRTRLFVIRRCVDSLQPAPCESPAHRLKMIN